MAPRTTLECPHEGPSVVLIVDMAAKRQVAHPFLEDLDLQWCNP